MEHILSAETLEKIEEFVNSPNTGVTAKKSNAAKSKKK